MHKKAYMKTVEAAVSITLAAIVVLTMALGTARNNTYNRLNIAELVDNELRQCALTNNISCIYSNIHSKIGQSYKFNISLESKSFISPPPKLPESNVYVAKYIFAGNQTIYQPTVLKVYYYK